NEQAPVALVGALQRVASSVPVVEVAHDADAARRGRMHDEAHAGMPASRFALQVQAVGAEAMVQAAAVLRRAREHAATKLVGIVVLSHAIAHAEPETVAEHAPAPRETLYEQAARTHARHAPQAATRLEVDGPHPVGRRAPHPQDETLAVRNLV